MSRIPANQLHNRDVARKRDGAVGRVIKVETGCSCIAHAGPWGFTLITVRFREPNANGGGDWVGQLSTFRSFFKVLP